MIKKISTSAPLDQQASALPTELSWLKHAQRVYIYIYIYIYIHIYIYIYYF